MKNLPKLLLAACLAATSLGAAAQICTAASSSIVFGNYNPQSAANQDNTGTITVTCQATIASLLMSYNVTLSAGHSNAFSQRKMASGSNTLNYQVYADIARTLVWGDGTSGTVYITDGYLLQLLGPIVKNYTVYGRVPGSQNVKAGSYLDTLTVLVTY